MVSPWCILRVWKFDCGQLSCMIIILLNMRTNLCEWSVIIYLSGTYMHFGAGTSYHFDYDNRAMAYPLYLYRWWWFRHWFVCQPVEQHRLLGEILPNRILLIPLQVFSIIITCILCTNFNCCSIIDNISRQINCIFPRWEKSMQWISLGVKGSLTGLWLA